MCNGGNARENRREQGMADLDRQANEMLLCRPLDQEAANHGTLHLLFPLLGRSRNSKK